MTEFFKPQKEDYRFLVNRWTSVKTLIQDEFRTNLDQSASDLYYMQKLIDDDSIDLNDEYSLECITVLIGRILANNVSALDWWITQKKQDRQLVLRYAETDLYLNIMDTVKEMVTPKGSINIEEIYTSIIEKINKHIQGSI